jgi:hypothetical protein
VKTGGAIGEIGDLKGLLPTVRVFAQELSLRETMGEPVEDRNILRQRATVNDEGRYLALRIQREIRRHSVLPGHERDGLNMVGATDFL